MEAKTPNTDSTDSTRWMNTRSACQYLGLSTATLDRAKKNHSLPYIKIGRICRYDRLELDAWMTANTVGGES